MISYLQTFRIVLILVVVCGLCLPAANAERGRSQSQEERMKQWLEREHLQREKTVSGWDKNHDGRITVKEIPERYHSSVMKNTKDGGLKFKNSFKISSYLKMRQKQDYEKLPKEVKERISLKGMHKSLKGMRKGLRGKNRSGGRSVASEIEIREEFAFGNAIELEPVPGFDVPFEKIGSEKKGSSKKSSHKSGPAVRVFSRSGSVKYSGSVKLSKSSSDKFKKYAAGQIKKYDKNHDGVLDRSECKKMRNNPRAADLNHDNRVSLSELTQYLGKMAAGNTNRSRSPGGSGGALDIVPGPTRFYNPQPELPEGLPDWFYSKDHNHDAQVSMSEYANNWSESKVAEFKRYDKNDDGMITTAEVLTQPEE